MFTTLEGKGILRSGTEEFLLAAEYISHDELAQEFTHLPAHVLFWTPLRGPLRCTGEEKGRGIAISIAQGEIGTPRRGRGVMLWFPGL